MSSEAFMLYIRNILLLSMIISATAQERPLLLRHEFMKLWRTLKIPVPREKTDRTAKSGKFWEIDMTNFEP